MANNSPNTTGLIPLNNRPRNECAKIQSAGGIACAKKRKELKKIAEIIYTIRQESGELDPAETAVITMFSKLKDPNITVKDLICILQYIQMSEKSSFPKKKLGNTNIEIDF